MPSPARSLQASLAPCPLEKSFKTTKSFREVLQDYQALGQGLWIPRALKGWKGPTQQWVRERQAGCCDILTGHLSVICCYFAKYICFQSVGIFFCPYFKRKWLRAQIIIVVQGLQGESKVLMSPWNRTCIRNNQLIVLVVFINANNDAHRKIFLTFEDWRMLMIWYEMVLSEIGCKKIISVFSISQ